MTGAYDEKHLVMLSIIYQLIDNNADTDGLNPNVQEYLLGLAEEFNSADDDEEEHFDRLYYFADTYFNNLYGVERTLN